MKNETKKNANLSLILIILSIITLAAAAILYFVGGGREKTSIAPAVTQSPTVSYTKGGKYVAPGELPTASYDAPKTEFNVTLKGDKFILNGGEYDLNGIISELKKESKPVAILTVEDPDEEIYKAMKAAFSGAGVGLSEVSDEQAEDSSEEPVSETE